MRFYVVAKCVRGQNEDLTLNLEDMTFNMLKIDEKVEEDKTYVLANGQIIEIRNMDFTMKHLYLEAFGKARRIKRGEFRFSKISKKSNVYVNENYFMFNGEKLIGRMVNFGEIEEIDNKGIESFNKLLRKLLLNDIVVLVKGKKIYRIFTYAKLNNLLNDSNQIDIFQFMNRNYTNELLVELKKKIDVAYDNLDEVRQRMNEELNKNNEK
ncbi:hypothetical protein [Wukongibacter sp. M2B1]|uniref:hypothetical protein n=1 Tax=Wukongibacter sp. M2B1 TaxID=3088895 RepID=UPI003D792B79